MIIIILTITIKLIKSNISVTRYSVEICITMTSDR